MTDLSNDQPMEPAVFDRGNPARRCTAHRKNGDRWCRKWAIRGGTVCATHGGRARQVREKAQRRLAEASDSLAKQLLGIASDENASESVRLAAIKDALDKSGVSAKTAVEIEVGPTKAWESILDGMNRPGMSGDSISWEGWSHIRWFVEEVPAGAARACGADGRRDQWSARLGVGSDQ